jgi:hypothetical protein
MTGGREGNDDTAVEGVAAAAEGRRPVQLETRFERFPAAIRGAFVLRGGDGNPHSLRFASATVDRVPAGPRKPFPTENRWFDVAPTRDLFVPFEFGVTDFDPGWYRIRCAIEVDGSRRWEYEGRAFVMAWPRMDVRRGSVRLGITTAVGGHQVLVERVEMGPDSSFVFWRAAGGRAEGHGLARTDPAEAPDPLGRASGVIVADGVALEVLPDDAAPRRPGLALPGERWTMFYPVPSRTVSAAVAVRLDSGEQSEPISVSLP